MWYEEEEEVYGFDLINYAKSINGGKNPHEDNIDERFNCGSNYPGFGHLTDEQIKSEVLGTVPKSKEE